jgi:acetate kinase
LNIIVLNGGSSSIKFSFFAAVMEDPELKLLVDGELTGIGTADATLSLSPGKQTEEKQVATQANTFREAISVVLDSVLSGDGTVDAVGYRVVHPGPKIRGHVRITEDVLKQLETAKDFAPLHDPGTIELIREMMKRMPHATHYACFDTVFHQTMPEEASVYAIPAKYREQGVKRYGFHGLSCESVIRQLTNSELLPKRLIIAHLGSGCSVTAVLDGESVDTTMGLTPTGGVVMGTRPGDLDPGLLFYLLRDQGPIASFDSLETMLNHDAGLVALTELPNNMKAIRQAALEGNSHAVLGLKVFTRSIRKAIGAFVWLLGGIDAIVFTGGIGEHDPLTRAQVLSDLTDITIDSALNEVKGDGVRRISASNSKTAVYAVPAQEDLVIALHVRRMVRAHL